MSNNKAIQIVLRIRPHENFYQGIKLDLQSNQLSINTPKDESQGYINNQRQTVKFKFDQIFDVNAKQQKVFDKVAKQVVQSAVQGFNGTIFAYGQTGSGKTYTMTGGGGTHDGHGIIPRTLRHIFLYADQKGLEVVVKIRYMQIYNGTGYDLLDPTIDPDNLDKVKMLEDLKRVKPMEGDGGRLALQNLSTHLAKTQQDALDLLLIGDTNRVTCTTLKNDQSTRSHCIFMIQLVTMRPGSDVNNMASINLVDLSGSQKLKATNYDQRVQKEAININLGLHYLERLIVSLNKKMNGENVHVPYRQSLMNLVLRDSIGGNCITRMVATMSPKAQDVLQTISTCKFAQRVALIKNNIQRNETVDPAIIIARLKRQNAELLAQLALLKGQQVKLQLDKYEIQDCQKKSTIVSLVLGPKFNFNHVRSTADQLNIIKKGGKMPLSNSSNANTQNRSNHYAKEGGGVSNIDQQRYNDQIKKLKLALQSRDNQIALLLSLINKKRQGKGQSLQSLPVVRMRPEQQQMMKSIIKQSPIQFKNPQKQQEPKSQFNRKLQKMQKDNWVNQGNSTKNQSRSDIKSIMASRQMEKKQIQSMLIKPLNLSNQDLLDHAKAFQAFRVSSRKYEAMSKNSQVLQSKMSQGKEVASTVSQTRDKIARLKDRLQQIQRQNAVKNLVDGIEREDPQQQQIRQQIVKQKKLYGQISIKLKTIKNQIESIQHLQKKNVQQMQRDFLKYVKYKQDQRQTTISAIDSSILASSVKDKQVQKHLESFMKARDELRKR